MYSSAAALVATTGAAAESSHTAAIDQTNTPPAVTLETVVTETLFTNPERLFYQAELAAAKGGRRQAGTYANPDLSATIGAKRITGAGLSAEGTAWSVSVQQPFEFPGRMALRKAIAEHDVQLAELGMAQFDSALAARTRALGFQLLTAQQKARATTEVANRLQELLDFLVQRDPAGVAPLLERRVIEAGVVTFRKRAIDAAQELQSALFTLNRLRGKPLDTPLRIADTELDLPSVPDKEALLNAAMKNNFDIQMRRAELEQQGFTVSLSRNERWPDISVGPFVSGEDGVDRETVVGIGISLPLPVWNRNRGNIEVAQAREIQAETSLFLVRQKTEQAVLEHWLAYRLKKQEMERWESDGIERFQQAAELGDRHYRLGSLPISTYIELQREYLDAVESILAMQSDALESLLQLEVLTQTELVTGTPTSTSADQ